MSLAVGSHVDRGVGPRRPALQHVETRPHLPARPERARAPQVEGGSLVAQASAPGATGAPLRRRSRVHHRRREAHALAERGGGRPAARRRTAWSSSQPRGRTMRASHASTPGRSPLVRACATASTRDASAEDAARFARSSRRSASCRRISTCRSSLQATEGCSFGTCTFCDLYHDGYRVKTGRGVRARTCEAVRDYLGESAILRDRSVFLGAANALAVPMPRLSSCSRRLPRRGPEAAFRPCARSWTASPALRKSGGRLRRLRGRSASRRVYVGLESGHDPLLAFVRKPATQRPGGGDGAGAQGRRRVGRRHRDGRAWRARRFSAGHVADTAAAVNAMALGRGRPPLLQRPRGGGRAPPTRSSRVGTGLTPARRSTNAWPRLDAIRAGLRFAGPPPAVARYDVREFVY